MKKIVFKFWILNFLVSIVLFVIYRVVIAETKSTDTNMLETILFILELFLNLGFSVVYFVAIFICSLTFFLNLTGKIRNNYTLSFLSFLGLPCLCVLYLIMNALTVFYSSGKSILTTFVLFSIVYLCILTTEFLLFRRALKTFERNA